MALPGVAIVRASTAGGARLGCETTQPAQLGGVALGSQEYRRYTTDMPIDEVLSRITRNSAVMGGKPCIRGMRITVGTVLGLLASGHTADEILRDYPLLESADIQAALSYAAWRAEEVELPLKAS